MTASADGEQARLVGYYGQPVIHGPHWKWLIITYFFFGGISGSASALAGLSRLFGRVESAIPRAATYVAFVALLPCPLLLIFDLGRPRRFLRMLRTFNPRSAMSIGTWGLLAFGPVCTLHAAAQATGDLARRDRRATGVPMRLLASLAVATGTFAAGYTGVLLAATAIPLWSKRPALLGPLFFSSAMTSGSAVTALALAVTGDAHAAEEARLQQLEAVCTVVEGALLSVWLYRLGATAQPLLAGDLRAVLRHGVVGAGMAAPLLLAAIGRQLPARAGRPLAILSSGLTLAGVFALRYVVVEGGRRSADDPRATFDLTS